MANEGVPKRVPKIKGPDKPLSLPTRSFATSSTSFQRITPTRPITNITLSERQRVTPSSSLSLSSSMGRSVPTTPTMTERSRVPVPTTQLAANRTVPKQSETKLTLEKRQSKETTPLQVSDRKQPLLPTQLGVKNRDAVPKPTLSIPSSRKMAEVVKVSKEVSQSRNNLTYPHQDRDHILRVDEL